MKHTYSLRARKTGGDGGLVIRFAFQDHGGSYLTIERQLPRVGRTFQCELEGNSFTVLRLAPEGR